MAIEEHKFLKFERNEGIFLNMSEYTWICLNLPEWLFLNFPIAILCLKEPKTVFLIRTKFDFFIVTGSISFPES